MRRSLDLKAAMKYGEYLETHMVKEWEEYYVSYKKLKKILKILSAQLLTKPPTEWTIGVSLSTPAPTNAAAMPADGDSGSESTGNDAPERVTENDFFKVRSVNCLLMMQSTP